MNNKSWGVSAFTANRFGKLFNVHQAGHNCPIYSKVSRFDDLMWSHRQEKQRNSRRSNFILTDPIKFPFFLFSLSDMNHIIWSSPQSLLAISRLERIELASSNAKLIHSNNSHFDAHSVHSSNQAEHIPNTTANQAPECTRIYTDNWAHPRTYCRRCRLHAVAHIWRDRRQCVSKSRL